MTDTLLQNMRTLTDESRIVCGIAAGCGNANTAVTETVGRAQEVTLDNGIFTPCVRPLPDNAVFDLASVTKLFTALSVVLLRQQGRLRLSDPLKKYDKRFVHIGDTTVYDLLCFVANLQTDTRIDAQTERENALRVLFTARRAPKPAGRYYSDMGSLTLKYVVEAASGMAYYDYVKAHILDPLGMHETFARVPETLLPRTACYNYERRIIKGRHCIDTGCPTGVVHDPKARILSDGGRDLCGHAGLFSTMHDMIRLAQGLIGDGLFPHSVLREIGINRTGYPLPDGSHTQYLGYLCYAKHPEQTYSEVPAYFGNGTLALNGFTGNHFSVDPDRNQFMILLGNRVHNRVTLANGRPDPNDPTVSILWDDGQTVPVSQNFTYRKDALLKEPMARILETLPFPPQICFALQ